MLFSCHFTYLFVDSSQHLCKTANSRIIFNRSSHSLLYMLRVLHRIFTYCLVLKRISESEALCLGFMGGRDLGEGWMVSSRWRQAGNLDGTGPWSPRKQAIPYNRQTSHLTSTHENTNCLLDLVLGVGEKLENKMADSHQASK